MNECVHFQWAQECQLPSRSIQSEYQVIFEYYKDIQAASLRTYITAQLSYMILHLHESGDFRNQSIAYKAKFHQIVADVRNVFKNKLQSANKDVWTCDPLDYNGSFVYFDLFSVFNCHFNSFQYRHVYLILQ